MITGLISIDSMTPLEDHSENRLMLFFADHKPLSFSSKDRNRLYGSTNITTTDLLTRSRIFLIIC